MRRRPRRLVGAAVALIGVIGAGVVVHYRGPAIRRILFRTAGRSAAARGKAVFAQSCSSGYCHGPNAAGAGAPRLSDRGFDAAYIDRVVTAGISGTAMPAFGQELSRPDLNAVVTYIASLNGAAATQTGVVPARLSAEELRGRTLFADALRGFRRCSTCHEAGGIGIPVAPAISSVPGDAKTLRAISTPHVIALRVDSESVPALLVSNGREAIFYDLTTAPPVLRRMDPNLVSLGGATNWKHAAVIGSYSDAELNTVLAYLRAVVTR